MVAVVLEDVAFELISSCAKINALVEASGYWVYKKFQRTLTATTTMIARGRSARKRKCCAVKMNGYPRKFSDSQRPKPKFTK